MKPAIKVTTENPELADRFNRVLGDTIEALEEGKIRYAFIGGIASGGLGRPRSTHDIDVFIKPEEAELTLRALAKKGFRTEKTDPSWLYKGFKENILVDVIFKSKGEIYLDTEMYQRVVTAEFHGKQLRFVSPEDLVVIKALAHSELTPGHWHDALALLSHANIDWEYLLKRAQKKGPRRMLSLLCYAQSADIYVPKNVIDQLYVNTFGDLMPVHAPTHAKAAPTAPQDSVPAAAAPGGVSHQNMNLRPNLQLVAEKQPDYTIAKLHEVLAEDSRTNELDIQIEQSGNKFLLRGEVLTDDRKDAVTQVVKETFPQYVVENQLRVAKFTEPSEIEEVK
ncbi:MAG: nucleotidyltransferase [Methylotenera sp.]|nr:nucleotidyltransferase [Oligoflexia bacterium]